ncbi:hypothetical protein TNCV_2401011 [Trichonephila clavipes]|nr:hypothetical protein TNCV_2401011 [Trichonephila clavipes]
MYKHKSRGEAQTQKIRDERKYKVFIESVVDKCNVYNYCSKLRPPGAIHARQRRWSDWRTRSKMPGISRHAQQLRIFDQRDPHQSQVESHKQRSSDVPIKSNRGSIIRR